MKILKKTQFKYKINKEKVYSSYHDTFDGFTRDVDYIGILIKGRPIVNNIDGPINILNIYILYEVN